MVAGPNMDTLFGQVVEALSDAPFTEMVVLTR